MSDTHKVTSSDGTSIAFDRSGDGPAIILVGGAFQYRAFDQRTAELAALLAASGFQVIHYDRRGRGDSTDTQPYAIEREIEDLGSLITEVGGTAALFGMSSGGQLALDAAAAGLAVPKIAVYEAPILVDASRVPIPPDATDRLREFIGSGRAGEAAEYFLTNAIGVPPVMVAGMRQSPIWPGFEAVAHTLVYDVLLAGESMSGRPLSIARWAAVACPVLVLDGGASAAWFRSGAEALAGVLPTASRRTLPGQEHGVAPDVLAPVLAEFFSG